MGIFNFKENKKKKILTDTFQLLNGYTAAFSTYNGGLYEMELIRSSIDTISTHASKLNPVVVAGKKYKNLEKMLQNMPNSLMTTQQFLSKLINILKVENNAFIVPIYSDITATNIVGIYPVQASGSNIIMLNNIPYLKYRVGNKNLAIEYERVGHLRSHYYDKEYYGCDNKALNPTTELINTQNQGIIEGIKQSANIRFLAKLTNVLLAEDMEKEKKRLVENNLGASNNGGVMLFDNKYSDIKTIDSKPFIVDDKQAELIQRNVYNYFHVSENVIQNKANEDEWNSFYEGCIEPISIQLGQVLTKMFFTKEEINRGCYIFFESSKLQFASNNTKLQVSQQLFDRGILTVDQVMDIWHLPHVEGGDKRYIRKEYTEINNLDVGGEADGENKEEGKSQIDEI